MARISNKAWSSNLAANATGSSKNFTRELRKLMKILSNRYQYIGDTDVDFEYAERIQVEDGMVAIYNHPDIGLCAMRMLPFSAARNIYGMPAVYQLRSYFGDITALVKLSDPNLFIVSDNRQFIPSSLDCREYANDLAIIRDTIESNVRALKLLYIIKGNKKRLNDMKALAYNYENGVPIFTDEDAKLAEAIEFIAPKVEYRVDKLEDQYDSVRNRFLRDFGFSVLPVEKSERLITAEANIGADVLIANDIHSYRNRVNMVNFYNKLAPPNKQIKMIKSNDYIYSLDSQLDNVPNKMEDDLNNTTAGGDDGGAE